MTTKTFTTAVLLSTSSGAMVTKSFNDVHEMFEHLAGHPVMTHQIPDLFDAVAEEITRQFPWLPGPQDVPEWGEDVLASVIAWVATYTTEHGDFHEVEGDTLGTTMRHPLDGLDPEKNLVVVVDAVADDPGDAALICGNSPVPDGCGNKARYTTANGTPACGRHTYGEPVTEISTGQTVRGLGRQR